MKRLACLVATGLVLLLVALTPAITTNATTTVVGATQSGRLRIAVTSMTPQVVGATDTTLTISGTLTNVGDRRISDLQIRLQLGMAASSEAALGSAGSVTPNDQVSAWIPIAGSPQPGQTLPWSINVPLAGARSLGITAPGVYPLLVNINGTPDYGGLTRLAAVSLLLPVSAVPNGTPVGQSASPAQLTLLWPIMDSQPRLIGSTAAGVVLSDDALASSLAPGGRLYGLVDSVTSVQANAPGGTALRSAMCFAVDPELLATVSAMTGGYQVRTATGGTVPGRGAAAAKLWLTQLRQVTNGQCVIAVPYADADLVALSEAGTSDLIGLAVRQTSAVASALPGAKLVSNVVWPANGSLDSGTLEALAKLGTNTVLLPSNATQPGNTTTVSLPTAGNSGAVRAVAVDQLTSSALLAGQSTVDTIAGVATPVSLGGVATQNGLAALLYRADFDTANRQLLVAPPRRWNAPESQLVAFLRTAQSLLADQSALPVALTDLIDPPANTASKPATATLNSLPATIGSGVSFETASETARLDGEMTDLLGSMNSDHATPVDPATLIDPLRMGLLGAMSSAWSDPTAGNATDGGTTMANLVDAHVAAITGRVSVQQSELTISLAAKDSHVPVAVHNSLPVDINVKLSLSDEAGLQATEVDTVRIPTNSSYTAYIPVRVTRSGRFSVETVLTTEGGTPLGTAARVEIVSNAYGTIILVVTGIAFGTLVLLSARRIYRRVRAAKRTAASSPAGLNG